MILQALKEYYDRKPDLPREGWELKAIPFLLVINLNGDFIQFQDTREGEGKKQRATEFVVPALGEKKGNGIKANLFWENIEYLLGVPVPTENRPHPDLERVKKQHETFKERINSIVGDNATLHAIHAFFGNVDQKRFQTDPLWPDILKLNQPLLFAIQGKGPVTEDKELRLLVDASCTVKAKRGRCLVTGEEDEIVTLEAPIRGVRDANTMGACLVGFQKKSGYDSFGKEQGANAPIGKSASFAYTTALNTLLGKDSRQKLQVGDATTVFWAAKDDKFETQVCDFFNEPRKDDPNRLTEAVKSLYRSTDTGAFITDGDTTRFYVLGLAPNAARIAVRFWLCGTVAATAGRFRQHFDDLRITHGPRDKDYQPLWHLLASIAPLGKSENIPPNLVGDTMRAILEGLPYPATLLQAAVRRNRVEQEVNYSRAALIKACLNSKSRSRNHNQPEEMQVSLDPTNTNIGYRLGRLFATLERLQVRVHTQHGGKEPNSTIRDRYYGAASGTPVTVFGTLIRLSKHHLSKLDNIGECVNFDKLFSEIVIDIPGYPGFPSFLDLADQGRFAIGYYHQKQDFFTLISQ